MKRQIEEARQDTPNTNDRVHTRLDVWPLPFLAIWAVLLPLSRLANH